MLKGKHVLLGVTGGIASYKIATLASLLVKAQADVHVIMTENAANFINPITFETLTGHKCITDTFDRNFEFKVEHIALAQLADVVMVAPATANVMAKLAHGLADDMLTTTVLASRAPKIIAPAMNTAMYENPVTQDNMELLKHYGMEVITPATGHLPVVIMVPERCRNRKLIPVYLQIYCMQKRHDRYESTCNCRTDTGSP